jgi:hypothetical protein
MRNNQRTEGRFQAFGSLKNPDRFAGTRKEGSAKKPCSGAAYHGYWTAGCLRRVNFLEF